MSLNRQILIELRLQHNNVISSMEHLLEVSTNLEKIFQRGLGLQRAVLEAQALERSTTQATRRARDEFNTLRNVVNQVFNGVRSLGNAMQSLSRIGLGGFVSTFENTLVSRFTGLFTSQLDNAITRFDIMKTFPLTMQQFGVSINASSAAIKKMNEAVIGLPTSLSEIVELSQRFVSVMPAMGLHGDELMSKASDFAIAINNAFLAGGNTSQQAYFAMMQLQDLFTKGELTEREWKSLSTGLQGAGLKIAEYFNYENFLQLAEAIDAGNVSLEQFVDGIIELGTSGGVLDKMARIYQTRLSSVFANIGNAFQRLIAGTMVEDEEGNYTFTGGILGTLDSLIANRYADNENINDLASYIRKTLIPRIDELSKVAETWIIDHEDEIFDFLDRLINYDWEGLTAKIADLLALKWDVLIDLLTKLPTGFLAFSSTLMGPVGQIISTIANILQPLVMAGLWGFKSPGSPLKKLFSPSVAGGATGEAAAAAVPEIGFGTAMIGTTAALAAIGAAGYALYEQWNAANEEAETYYLTIDKLKREGELTKENLETLRKQIESNISTVQEEYDAYLEDYRKRYELYVNGGGEESFEEWLPWWARWKKEDYEKAIAEYEQALTRIHNLEIMTSDTWDTFVTEADKIGGIPEDLKTAFEQGTVEIPDTLDEFLALISGWTGEVETEVDEGFKGAMTKGKKQVDQGIQDIKGSMDTFVNDFSLYGERLSGQGFFLGDSFGRALYNRIASWLNEIFPLLDLDYAITGRIQTKPTKDTSIGAVKKGKGTAFGGRIYRQGGTDKDTVLTWLQPGEYVLRKKAADKLGGDILNKLNNFNFKGAVQALSERVGAGMSPYAYAGANGNTRIYNNNAQATINVNNATQEFTQRRASKWVRGLK